MSVEIEDVTDTFSHSETQPRAEGAPAHDEDEDFQDAASDASFEDAQDHFHNDSPGVPHQDSCTTSSSAAAASSSASHNSINVTTAAEPSQGGPATAAHRTSAAPARPDSEGEPAAGHSGDEGRADKGDALFGGPLPQYHRQQRPSSAEHEAHASQPEPEPQSEPAEALSPEETQKRTEQAEELKLEGNALFGQGSWEEAQAKYSEALDAAPPDAPQRAAYFANRAAAAMKLRQWSDAASDCTAAVDIDSGYLKAYMRRATAYEESKDLERALADHKKVLELDPGNRQAAAQAAKLEPVVLEQREKMKDEMIGKLKDLGNTVLGKFGMSVDNFKSVKGPDGSYSIQFQQ